MALYCTLTNARDGSEVWHGSLADYCAENDENIEAARRYLINGPVHVSGGAGPLMLLRLDTVRLTRDDTAITDLDARILLRLADRMARVRPAWFEPAADSREAAAPSYARRTLSQTLSAHYFRQAEGYRAAHAADCQIVANMDRWSRADWCPSASVEFSEA